MTAQRAASGGSNFQLSCAMLIAIPGLLCLGALVGLPMAVAAVKLVCEPAPPQPLEPFDSFALLLRSTVWAVAVAVGAAVLGWFPGRALRTAGVGVSMVVVVASLIPAYAIFFCWWRVLRPGNAIADYAIAYELTPLLRASVLGCALVAWSWPIAAWICALRRSPSDETTRALLELDGASVAQRLAACWRSDCGSLTMSVVVIALVLLGETTAFDAAQVATLASEIRALDASGASVRSVMIAALPAIILALAVSTIVARLLVRTLRDSRDVSASDGSDLGVHAPHHSNRVNRGAGARVGRTLAIGLVVVLTLVPVVWLAVDEANSTAAPSLDALHARGAFNTLMMAAVSGALCALIAIAGASLMMCGGRRTIPIVLTLSLVALTAPATVVALATAECWRALPMGRTVYDSFVIVSLAESARYSAVAFVIGLWAATALTKPQREIWVTLGRTPRDFIRMGWPILLRASIGGWLVTTLLAASETAVAARLEPPGMDWISTTLLNAIHYQDARGVSGAIPWMAALACIGALVAVLAFRTIGRGARHSSVGTLLLCVVGVIMVNGVGCGSAADEGSAFDESRQSTVPLPTDQVIGRAGRTEGRFDIPRAFTIDPATGALFVVDKSGRVQRFASDGTFELAWKMPKFDNGKPTGMTFGPDGLLYVADTHEHRILLFDREGVVQKSIGSYGQAPGQFVYPTDVAFDPDGKLYVSEYGGNDRIQVFDKDGRFLHAFGVPGDGLGQFARPQSLAFSKDGSELFVADSCNHRIQVFSAEGTLKRVLCRPGARAGEVAYPYGLCALDDGSLLIAEFGNCRVQRIDAATGESLAMLGGGGRSVGRLNAPWSVAVHAGRAYVLDCANGRVQSMPITAFDAPREGAQRRR
ncbi:MAG: hypothetical protein EXS17_07040 [Phycisphaerales bacterium]|nr:hypothetical protein [Phycisphaerales bacterium]